MKETKGNNLSAIFVSACDETTIKIVICVKSFRSYIKKDTSNK